MSSDVEFSAKKILKTAWIRNVAIIVACMAIVAWTVSSVIQTFDQRTLVKKNERLVAIVEEQERFIEELDVRLQCRATQRDALDQAIGRGLVAVANDDSAELERQAQLIIQVADDLETECEPEE